MAICGNKGGILKKRRVYKEALEGGGILGKQLIPRRRWDFLKGRG